jgi:hypothetical protein
MNLFEFMSDSPVLSFFIIFVICLTVGAIFKQVVIMIKGHPVDKGDV